VEGDLAAAGGALTDDSATGGALECDLAAAGGALPGDLAAGGGLVAAAGEASAENSTWTPLCNSCSM
jgi:hypothetical protein